jgi:hypothetical protein
MLVYSFNLNVIRVSSRKLPLGPAQFVTEMKLLGFGFANVSTTMTMATGDIFLLLYGYTVPVVDYKCESTS